MRLILYVFIIWRLWKKSIYYTIIDCLFRRKSQADVIARSSCKKLNVAHYSKSIKNIITKLGIYTSLFFMIRCSCKTRGIALKAIGLELCPFLIYIFLVEWWPLTDEHWYCMRCSCFLYVVSCSFWFFL